MSGDEASRGRAPDLVLDVWEAHVLDLAEALPHHVDVVNVQEDKLGTLVVILVLIPTSPTHNIRGEIIQNMQKLCHLAILATALTFGLAS